MAYELNTAEISSVFPVLKENLLIIGCVNQQFVAQKIFNDGNWYNYSHNNIKIRFHSNEDLLGVLYCINRIKFNLNQTRQEFSQKK